MGVLGSARNATKGMFVKIVKPTLIITGPMTVNVEVAKPTNIEQDTKEKTRLRMERELWLATQFEMARSSRLKAAKSAAKYAAFTDTMTIIPNLLTFVGFALPAILLGTARTDKD